MVHLMQIFSMPIEKGDKKEDGHSGFKTNKLGEGGGGIHLRSSMNSISTRTFHTRCFNALI